MDIREDKAWLLQSRFNPLPVAGSLSLGGGRISFTVDAEATDESLGWLAALLGSDDLGSRLAAGESVVAFDYPLDEAFVTWPITGGGSMMIVRTPERRWVVSYELQEGGAIGQTMSLISGRRRAREWKKALAESGA